MPPNNAVPPRSRMVWCRWARLGEQAAVRWTLREENKSVLLVASMPFLRCLRALPKIRSAQSPEGASVAVRFLGGWQKQGIYAPVFLCRSIRHHCAEAFDQR